MAFGKIGIMYKSVFVWASLDTFEQGGLLGTKVKESELRVNPGELAARIQDACNSLEREGLDVISVMPVDQGGIGGSGGWSFTYGAVITAKSAR